MISTRYLTNFHPNFFDQDLSQSNSQIFSHQTEIRSRGLRNYLFVLIRRLNIRLGSRVGGAEILAEFPAMWAMGSCEQAAGHRHILNKIRDVERGLFQQLDHNRSEKIPLFREMQGFESSSERWWAWSVVYFMPGLGVVDPTPGEGDGKVSSIA